MGDLLNDIDVVRIYVPVVLAAILPDRVPQPILQHAGYGVFTRIHVSHRGLLNTVGERLPGGVLDLINFTHVYRPNGGVVSQNIPKLSKLGVLHPDVEVLDVQRLDDVIVLRRAKRASQANLVV